MAAVFPDPRMSKDWQEFGSKLIDKLTGLLPGANAVPKLAVYSKTRLPKASEDGMLIYVSDDIGGGVPAFSQGGQWRRVTDRAVIS
jgi:hypothetical protein